MIVFREREREREGGREEERERGRKRVCVYVEAINVSMCVICDHRIFEEEKRRKFKVIERFKIYTT